MELSENKTKNRKPHTNKHNSKKEHDGMAIKWGHL